jgi:signal transduction histidine kinase
LEVEVPTPERQQSKQNSTVMAKGSSPVAGASTTPLAWPAPRAAPRLAPPRQPHHTVQFYDDDAFLCDSVASYVAAGLASGDPVCVIATEAHREAFAARLARDGVNVEAARARGALTWLDAQETLAQFMVDGMPDWPRFSKVVGGVLEQARRGDRDVCVRAYGEMVDVLWRAGSEAAALKLEEMWNELGRTHPLSLLCAYVMGNFRRTGDAQSFRNVCAAHSHVLPTETYQHHDAPEPQLRQISELQQRARALEDEIEQRKVLESALREALVREQEAREEAERSVRYNEMFAGMLGHDLRNPLSAITTGANYITRLNSGPKTTRAATRILTSAERMARMIEQLLDFTRIRVGGGLPLVPVRLDLEEVCCKVKDELEAAHPERSVVVDVQGNVVGEWDQDRLFQVLSNLVGNAIHHGDAGAPVSIRCDGTDAAVVKVQIHNGGVVPPEVLPLLFEPFRGNTRYQRTRGLGLGLFITQQIISAHGATIDVMSEAATGTTFYLQLPRKTPTRTTTPLPPRAR